MTRTREFSTWLATRWPRPRPGTSDVRRCRELGLAAYLVKPVTRKELRATVMKVLAGSPMLVTRQRDVSEPSADRPLRILLAEDNPVNQKVASSLLSRLGHQVLVAADGQAALDAYRRQTFDLILMDVQMPLLSGSDATRAIRQIEQTTGAHIPIIAMTARAMKGDRERCLDAGMDDYISKPIQGTHVLDVIRRTHRHRARLDRGSWKDRNVRRCRGRGQRRRMTSVAQGVRYTRPNFFRSASISAGVLFGRRRRCMGACSNPGGE